MLKRHFAPSQLCYPTCPMRIGSTPDRQRTVLYNSDEEIVVIWHTCVFLKYPKSLQRHFLLEDVVGNHVSEERLSDGSSIYI